MESLILAQTLHGSRLYGLDNPNSDWDYKSIHLPSKKECMLLRAPVNIHRQDEIFGVKAEYESFALQEFLKLAARGEDIAITMLHVPDHAIATDSWTFKFLRKNRNFFYTKKMSGMVGYARSMASKYALRAERMETVLKVIHIIEQMQAKGVARLGQAWEELPALEYTEKYIHEEDRGADKRVYEVAGKMLPATITPIYALDILCKLRDSYGERVNNVRAMAGQDTKAISHAFRVGYQLLHIYQDGDYTYSLPETAFLRDVKEGRLHYFHDKLDVQLDELIQKVERLAARSSYPEKVNSEWMDEIVLQAYEMAWLT